MARTIHQTRLPDGIELEVVWDGLSAIMVGVKLASGEFLPHNPYGPALIFDSSRSNDKKMRAAYRMKVIKWLDKNILDRCADTPHFISSSHPVWYLFGLRVHSYRYQVLCDDYFEEIGVPATSLKLLSSILPEEDALSINNENWQEELVSNASKMLPNNQAITALKAGVALL